MDEPRQGQGFGGVPGPAVVGARSPRAVCRRGMRQRDDRGLRGGERWCHGYRRSAAYACDDAHPALTGDGLSMVSGAYPSDGARRGRGLGESTPAPPWRGPAVPRPWVDGRGGRLRVARELFEHHRDGLVHRESNRGEHPTDPTSTPQQSATTTAAPAPPATVDRMVTEQRIQRSPRPVFGAAEPTVVAPGTQPGQQIATQRLTQQPMAGLVHAHAGLPALT